MHSSSGLLSVWTQGDFVTRAVALLLLGMSLATWIIILIKTLDLIRYKKIADDANDFWHSEDFAAGLSKLGSDPSKPFRLLVIAGREATAHHRSAMQLHGALDVSDWVTRSLRNTMDEFTSRLQSGLAILASVGLAVAIPAVLGYNALVRGNKGVLQKLNRFAHDLHAYFVTGARVSGSGPAHVVPMKKA